MKVDVFPTKFKIHVIKDVYSFDFGSLEDGLHYAIKDVDYTEYNLALDRITKLSLLENGLYEWILQVLRNGPPYAGMKQATLTKAWIDHPRHFTQDESEYLHKRGVNPIIGRMISNRYHLVIWGTKVFSTTEDQTTRIEELIPIMYKLTTGNFHFQYLQESQLF